MSGGHFEYQQYRIEDIARDIHELIESNNEESKNEWGDTRGRNYPPEVIEKFRETVHTLRQAAEMAQRVDWLVSGDDGEDSFLRRWQKEVRPYYTKNNQTTKETKWKTPPVGADGVEWLSLVRFARVAHLALSGAD